MILRGFSLVVCLFFLTSCVETVILAGGATGALVVRDKSLQDTQKDIVISTSIATRFIEHGLKNPGNSIDVTVNEGRVLLTGIARDPDKATRASELAWKVKGVKEVIDEIQLDSDGKLNAKDFTNSFGDYLISWQIESKLFFTKRVTSVNYQVTTVNRTVYLLGISYSNDELNKVLEIASKVKGVKKVVNHIISINDARRR